MKKKLLHFLCLILLSWIVNSTYAQSYSIAWASEDVAEDVNYITALEGEGYMVYAVENNWINLPADSVAILDTFDLVIISRRTNSGQYGEGTDVTGRWQSLTAPVLNMNNYVNRSSRLQLLNTTVNVESVNKYMIAELNTHAIFTNTSLNASDSTLELTTENYQSNDQTTAGNGTVLASDPATGVIAIAEWSASEASYEGGGVQAGKRMFYATSFSYNLSSEGLNLYLNTVEYILTGSVVDVVSPTDILISNTEIDETSIIGSEIGTLSAVDPQDNIASYSLISGVGDTDNASFSIDGDKLKSAVNLDYETAQSYSVRVLVTDFTSKTYEKVLSITLRNVEEPATDILLSNDDILEGTAIGTSIGMLSAIDDEDDAVSYALVAGTGDDNNASFSIDGDVLKSAVVFDYSVAQTQSIRVEVTDAQSNTLEKEFTISIIEYSVNPYNILISSNEIAELESIGTVVGTLTGEDVQDDIASFALVSGTGDTDNASFTVDVDVLKTAVVLDYETLSTLSIRLEVTDDEGNTFQKSLVINVIDVDEDPTDISLSVNTLAENSDSGTEVGTLTGTDPQDDIASFALVSGTGDTDNLSFTITGDKLISAVVFDFETIQLLSVLIEVTDAGGNTYEKAFAITIIDEDEDPTDITLSSTEVAENEVIGTEVGVFGAVDPQNDVSMYTLVAGMGDDDNSSFTIIDDKLNTATVFDFETDQYYSIRVMVTDASSNTFEKAFSISVSDDISDNVEMDSSYYGVYTENPKITVSLDLDGTINSIANVSGFNITESTTDVFEGTTSLTCEYDGIASWAMMQILTTEAVDLSAFSDGYYYITMRTTTTESFHLRLTDGINKPKIDFVNGLDPYGLERDGEWHTLKIPISDFKDLASGLDMSAITEFLVLRSGAADDSGFTGSTADMTIEFDDIYFLALTPSSAIRSIKTNIELSVYPNPAKDYLTVENIDQLEGSIYSISGTKVMSINQNINRIDISELTKGMYIILLTSDDENYIQRFVKE